MRYLTIIIIILSLFSCNPKIQSQTKIENLSKGKNSNKKFGEELIKNDFLKFADTSKVDSLKIGIVDDFMIYDENSNKFAHIDAEELAEFNFDFFLPQLNKILSKRNINLTIEKSADYQNTNDIFINNEKVNLYNKQELQNGKFWESAPRNFFRKLNEILKKKNSEEKFYLLYGSNDLSTLLLTEKQFEIIKKVYGNEPKELPYLP